MSELDKFKRRMIRSAARLLIHEKQDEDKVWQSLQKESGCDCKLLWQRMRALTIKKLERLLAADDQPEQLSAVVRLTPTDWLLCDLVLVHEELDLIGNKHIKKSTEPRPLSQLFELVVHFKIEETKDTRALADAWTKLTAYYNRPMPKGQRRQASAMLLQRRWYQLKVSTRDAFYKLWHSYRGNANLWQKVWKPSVLQSAIAKRFPLLITSSFQDWEELINAGKVILPKEFEERVRNPPKVTQSTGTDSSDPDLVVLEPQIDTIDIADSDSDEPNADQSQQPVTPVLQDPDETQETGEIAETQEDSNEAMQYEESTCKTEPADGLSNVKIIEATHVPEQDITNDLDPGITIKVEKEDPSDPAVKRRNLSIEMSKYFEATNEVESDTNNDVAEDLIQEKADQYLNTSREVRHQENDSEVLEIPEDVDVEETPENVADDSIKEKTDAYLNNKPMTETVTDTQEEIVHETIPESPKEIIAESPEEIISDSPEEIISESPEELPDEIICESPQEISDELTSEDFIKDKTDAFLQRGKVPEALGANNNDSGSLEKASISDVEELISNELIKSKADEYVRKTIKETFKQTPPTQEKPSSDEEELFDDIIKQRADEFVKQADIKKLITETADEMPIGTSEDSSKVNKVALEAVETADILSEGMEIVDDGIEYFDEDDDMNRTETDQAGAEEQTEAAAFDLKLIMEPVVYTLKLDQMAVFTHTAFDSVANRETIEKVFKASKPVSKKAINNLQNVSTGSDRLSQSYEDCRRIDQNITDNDLTSQPFNEDSRSLNENVTDENRRKDKKITDLISQQSFSVYNHRQDENLRDEDIASQELSIEINRRLDQKLLEKTIVSPALSTQLNCKPDHNIVDKSLVNADLSAEIEHRLDQKLLEKGVIKQEPITEAEASYTDNSESEISDDLKVKLSSYLLQKPRSRSYNPIQLCKNPDFNTRLKRLTVGFFSSYRNRQLLKACKPMSIDLHKAFESKLINGTIYLKGSQDSDKRIEYDSEEMFSSTVQPSAMPVQSLINNTIEYMHRSTPSRTVDLTAKEENMERNNVTVDLTSEKEKQERNKVINLKDINEIRRINQKLQTAQVTPIRVQESVSEEPVVAPTPDEAMVMAGDGKHKAHANQHDLNHPQVDDTHNSRASTSKEIPIVEPHQQKRKNTVKEKVRKPQTKTSYTPTHWNVPVRRNAPKLDEFLITIDTLNKMINKMNGIEELPSKKAQIWSVNAKKRKFKTLISTPEPEVKEESSRKVKNDPKTSKAAKDDQSTQAPVVMKPTIIVKHKKPKGFCCWAREKVAKAPRGIRMRRVHECETTCQCCCRHQWADMLVNMYTMSSFHDKQQHENWQPMLEGLMPGMLTPGHYEQYAEECKSLEANIEYLSMRDKHMLSKISLQLPPKRVLIPVPASVAHANDDVSPAISISGENVQMPIPPRGYDYDYPARGQPMEVTSVTEHAGKHYIAVTSRETSTRIVLREPPEHFYILAPKINKKTSDKASQTNETVDIDLTTEDLTVEMNSSTETILEHYLQQKTLVIDGSLAIPQICTLPVTSPPASAPVPNVPVVIKTACSSDRSDKMVYLSSKSIAKEPSGNPIYLGKNKILLTTVKFPSDLCSNLCAPVSTMSQIIKVPAMVPIPPLSQIIPLPATTPISPVTLVSTCNSSMTPQAAMPAGVQIILPPDGQLTYMVEPGVVLDAEQRFNIQDIISNIKKQIDPNSNPLMTVQTPTVAAEDVVTLSDDETNQNNEAAPEPALASEGTVLTNEPDVTQPTIEPEVIQTTNELEVAQATNSVTQTCNELEVEQPTVEPDVIQPTTESDVADESETINEATNTIPEVQITTSDVGISEDKETDSSATVTNEPIANVEPPIVVSSEAADVVMENEEAEGAAATTAPEDSNEETSSSRNLLMDLMEMSGISAEDTKVTAKEVAPAPVQVMPAPSDIPVINLSIPQPTTDLSKLPELSPVTSLAELKYACEHNGKFFKLDFETGILLPINVCIKKNPKIDNTVKKVPTFYVSAPKSVIDLTDDGNLSSYVENPQNDVSMNYKLPQLAPLTVRKIVRTNLKAKPLPKLPEGIYGKFQLGTSICNKTRVRRILNHTPSRNERGYTKAVKEGEFSGVVRRRSERKQNLNKIEARIDMVDSDAPLEEEYLIDSESDDDEFRPPPYMRKKIRMDLSRTMGDVDQKVVNKTSPRSLLKPIVRETIELSNQDEDSSDDEPLAKKAKKKDGNSSTTVEDNSGAAEDGNEERLDESIFNEERLYEERLNDSAVETPNEDPVSAGEDPASAGEDPASAGEDEMEIDDTIQPTFLANDEGQDEDEDCILGV